MKRLLCVISCMNAGGAESFLMKLYRSLDRTIFQFDFAVNIKEEGFYDKEIYSLGGKIHRFPSKSESFWGYIKGLKKIIQENQYDYVLRVTSNGMGFLDLAIAKMAGAKVCVARSSNSSDGGGVKAFLAHWIGKTLFKRFVDVKIAPSSEAAIYTFGKKDYNRGLVHILHNGLDLDYFSYTKKGRIAVRNEFDITPNQTVLGHVGRFSIQKNHSFLLKIFQCFHESNPDSVLMLVGDGELKDDVQKKVQEMGLEKNVIFAGVRSDMPSIYSAMDVFVFSSLYEGMPNAVIEAQACGLRCVVSDKITREANVSGFVTFLPLDLKNHEWMNTLSKYVNTCQVVPAIQLRKNGYDIKYVTKKFLSFFGNK